MEFHALLRKSRSYRRFDEGEKMPLSLLREFVANVRLTPSPANLQPLKFVLVNRESTGKRLFKHLKWAAYLSDWQGPEEGERPTAYIVMLGNRSMSMHIGWDYGIALQTIMLSATERGFGGCAIAACDKEKIRTMLDIPPEYEIAVVIALGKPIEKVAIDEVVRGDIKYWRDEAGVHHVPKRSVDDLILKEYK